MPFVSFVGMQQGMQECGQSEHGQAAFQSEWYQQRRDVNRRNIQGVTIGLVVGDDWSALKGLAIWSIRQFAKGL
jgi:hypothetical protein